jgi:transposase InsO family protein
MITPASQFTAAEISRASGSISRQGVAKLLMDTPAGGVRVVRGKQEVSTWTYAALPETLRARLDDDAKRQGYRNGETLLANPPAAWTPPVPLREVAEDELNRAAKLRDIMLPFLRQPDLAAESRNAQLAARYGDVFGSVITTDYARKLYQRTLDRDEGVQDFGRLELYLPENPKRKEAVAWTVTTSDLADVLPALESRIASIATPANPPKAVVRSVWHVAFDEYSRLVSAGAPAERAARLVRDFLHARAPFVPRNRDTLLKAWNDKLPRWLAREGMPGALVDWRCKNGTKVIVPEKDVARLRWSATTKHSGRLDCAWREEYEQLSELTRAQGRKDGRCPRSVVNAVNRVLLDGLTARRQGKRYLEKLLGNVLRDISDIPAMYAWVMDDLTCTLEVFATNEAGETTLNLIQLIAVMDVRSRRIVGWSASLDKGPTAELVCEAFLDAARRTEKIPHHLFLENGWVFGRAGYVVGKYDDSGEVIVAGLAEYGCQLHHFLPGSPTSKGELEKSFDLIQQRMERHPGYTSRNQRLAAPDQFRREQIEMRRKVNPRDPRSCRYDFPQGVRAIEKIVNDYNATVQHGALNGLSPDQAFLNFQDRTNPATWLPAKLRWLLGYKQRCTIKHSGVAFTHFGENIRVRGGNLASMERIGREYWVVMDRRDADCVTFMSLDFTDVFTEPLRPVVPYDISETAPESDALETEYRTKAEQRRVVESEYQGLMSRFGDPRKELLHEAQAATREALELDATIGMNARMPLIESNHRAAGEEGQRQRAALRKKRQSPAPVESNDARPGFDEAAKSIFGKSSGSKDYILKPFNDGEKTK